MPTVPRPTDPAGPRRRRKAPPPEPAAPSPRPHPPAASGFYAGALDESDRIALVDAGAVIGLDQEIALLRLRLRRVLRDCPDDHPLAVRAIELLVRAVGAAGKLPPAEQGGMLERISADLDGILQLLAEAQAEES